MAMTHDYLDQLDQNVGIAPANSQEEYQAAQTIADIMRRHGVEPSIEEFDAKAFGGVMDQILFAMLFVGMLLVGIGAVPLTVIGFVLVALPVAAFVARYLGNDFVEKLGPSARSQNVVAFHKGEGPLVQKGVRPIVIVAHYDTPHGVACAMLLPIAMEFNKPVCAERLAKVAVAMGVDTTGMSTDEAADAAIAAVKQLSADVDIPHVCEAMKADEIEVLAKDAMADACFPGNPREATLDDVIELFKKICPAA